MHWTCGYIIDDTGHLRWREGLRIKDEEMKAAYRGNPLLEFFIESCAMMGVKTGMA